MKQIILVTVFLTTAFAQADIAKPAAPKATTQATKPAATAATTATASATTKAAVKPPAPVPIMTATGPSTEKPRAVAEEVRLAVKKACATDLAKTGCKAEFGQGMMRCIHGYKAKNKTYAVSESCRDAAMKADKQ